MKYIIKSHYKLILLFIVFIYVIVCPVCFSAIDNNIGSRELIVFEFMQKLISIPSIIVLSYLYHNYVEQNYKELMYTIDRKIKYVHILTYFMMIQIILLPFYIIMIVLVENLISYIFIFCLQLFTLFNMYYLLSKFIDVSFIILGCMICYMGVFLFLFDNTSLISIFILDKPFELITFSYYLKLIIISILSIYLGIILEKRKVSIC